MSIEKIERTPQRIIGDDAYMQLMFEGYAVVKADELSRLRTRVAELEAAGYGKPVIRQVERAPLVYDGACDDERCRWPECTCYGPQAPNHCKRQTRRTLDARALSERAE